MAPPLFCVPTATKGQFYMMPCPQEGAVTPVLDHLKSIGATAVLSMLLDQEAAELGMVDAPALCDAGGMTHLSYPIVDFGLPDLADFEVLIDGIVARLEAGQSIAVHCRAGIGRSGMVAACVLIALGVTTQRAIAKVSAARGVSIPDTVEQGSFIAAFESFAKGGRQETQ